MRRGVGNDTINEGDSTLFGINVSQGLESKFQHGDQLSKSVEAKEERD